jgi:hypothetical protein
MQRQLLGIMGCSYHYTNITGLVSSRNIVALYFIFFGNKIIQSKPVIFYTQRSYRFHIPVNDMYIGQ